MLRWCLDHKGLALLLPALLLITGASAWLGFARVFGFVPPALHNTASFAALDEALPGLGKEFMPPLDEGSFLWMPTTMPHASIGEVLDVLQKQDAAIAQIPEVESAVGKLGRAETPLDPAPISMIETVINYRAEYLTDEDGRRRLFAFDERDMDVFRDADGSPVPGPDGAPYTVSGRYLRDGAGRLVPDANGRPFRLWRPPLDPALNPGRAAWPGIQGADDIWAEITRAGQIPRLYLGTKVAADCRTARHVAKRDACPLLGIEIKGPSLEAIESAGLEIERLLKEVPTVEAATVNADRIVGKPYLEIHIDREAIARHGIALQKVQDVIEIAIGGKLVTTTVEGRERYPVRVRYMRELRDSAEELVRILVPAPDGVQIPLGELAEIRYVRGPQVIKSEDTFLLGYVLFDKKPGYAEVDVVEACRYYLASKRANGDLVLDTGVSYTFAGSYENQLRAQKKLSVLLPHRAGDYFPHPLFPVWQRRYGPDGLFRGCGSLGRWFCHAVALRAGMVFGFRRLRHPDARPLPRPSCELERGGVGGFSGAVWHCLGQRRDRGDLSAPTLPRAKASDCRGDAPCCARRWGAAHPPLPNDGGHHDFGAGPRADGEWTRRRPHAADGHSHLRRHDGGGADCAGCAGALLRGRGVEAAGGELFRR